MDPTSSNDQGNRQFAADISSIQNDQRPFMQSQSQDDSTWNSIQPQSGSDDLEHYTFHSAHTANAYSHRNMSGESSPRSGNSPSYYPSAPGQWQSHIADGSLPSTSYPSRECVSAPKANTNLYYSSAPFPPLSTYFSSQSFDGSEANLSVRSHPEPYREQHHYNSPPSECAGSMVENGHSSSPCSSTMPFRTDEDLLSQDPASETGDDYSGSQFMHDIHGSKSNTKVQEESPAASPNSHSPNRSSSPLNLSNMTNSPASTEEPYAQLIYRAFMSTKPKYAMTLQDIYQWFRENTDKGKSDNKGWQNSIRHNLSMNQAFTKVERRSSTSTGSDDTKDKDRPTQMCLSSDSHSNSGDNKKSTKWYLEPWAVTGGVQSTTRYRKGNASRRGGVNSRLGHGGITSLTSSADAARRSVAYAAARAASGRKGGIRRFKARQEAMRLQSSGTNGLQMHHYQHPSLHLQSLQYQNHQRQRQHHLMRDIITGQYPNYLPAMNVPPAMDFDFPASSATNSVSSITAATDPQLVTGYPPPPQQQQSQSQPYQLDRAPSEPTIDEPLTPEPATYHPLKGGELPFHRVAGLSGTSCASNANSGTASGATFPHYSLHHQHQHHPANGHGSVGVVGVYDEVAERYGGGAAGSWGGGHGSGSSTGGGGGGGVPTGVQVDGLPYGGY
ncbi:hypothetical protein V8F20_007843 [Naviculisporaceae sp. PSN 640]